MKTLGQAIDEATAMHQARFPESEVYSVAVRDFDMRVASFKVEVDATHFSQPLTYVVKK